MIKTWIALTAIVISASALHASEPVTPTDKTNVFAFAAGNNTGEIEYRHLFLHSRLALIALVGYHGETDESSDSQQGYHLSQHTTELGVGLRHNFTTVEQIRPFVQLTVARSSASATGSPCGGLTFWGYAATGGGEYFVGRRVSLEGSAGLQIGSGRSGCFLSNGEPSRVHSRSLNTFRTALGINFYF